MIELSPFWALILGSTLSIVGGLAALLANQHFAAKREREKDVRSFALRLLSEQLEAKKAFGRAIASGWNGDYDPLIEALRPLSGTMPFHAKTAIKRMQSARAARESKALSEASWAVEVVFAAIDALLLKTRAGAGLPPEPDSEQLLSEARELVNARWGLPLATADKSTSDNSG